MYDSAEMRHLEEAVKRSYEYNKKKGKPGYTDPFTGAWKGSDKKFKKSKKSRRK